MHTVYCTNFTTFIFDSLLKGQCLRVLLESVVKRSVNPATSHDGVVMMVLISDDMRLFKTLTVHMVL